MDTFCADWLAEHDQTAIHCRAACAACCRLAVHATCPEATAVAASLDREQSYALDLYVDQLLAATAGLGDLSAYLRRHRRAGESCPFLRPDRHCGIYAVRPLACRALLATRPADWCGLDLAALDAWDRQLFQQGLDPEVVSWPTHYVAATRDFGQQREEVLLTRMLHRSGWALCGNFPLLVWLERTRQLSGLEAGAATSILTELGLAASPLLDLRTAGSGPEG